MKNKDAIAELLKLDPEAELVVFKQPEGNWLVPFSIGQIESIKQQEYQDSGNTICLVLRKPEKELYFHTLD